MTTKNLLVELIVEELPPKALQKLSAAFGQVIFAELKADDFLEDQAELTLFATPRRLALHITRVRDVSLPREIVTKLMPKSVGYDANGNTSPALIKKIKAMYHDEVDVSAIIADRVFVQNDGKIDLLMHRDLASGEPLQVKLESAIEEATQKLPVPKLMSYQLQNGETVHFVRPAHQLVVLHGGDVVENIVVLGLQSSRQSIGHRFLCGSLTAKIDIPHADAYVETLKEKGKVIASFAGRKEKIRADLLAQAAGDTVLMPESLLDEVTALVEWPVVYACSFEDQFLAVPQECLILTMQTNQKYFALTDAAGKLRSRFLVVSNLATDDPRHIIQGNERVVRPRLSDAKFFFEQDQKKTLASRLPGLQNVVYHNKLGSQGERTARVVRLAAAIARALGYDAAGIALAERGALLAKTDLVTDMVGEFPELQGIMGTYYARHDGEPEEVAQAAAEHYQPRYAGDALPASATGTAVALADKLETLVGIWGIGLQPTGDKDPFALRRHALGILRMLVEKRLPLSLPMLLDDAVTIFTPLTTFTDPRAEVLAFFYDRLRGLLRERGYGPHEIEAVVAPQPACLDNLLERLDAVRAFATLPESQALAAANKRITNILKKADAVPTEIDTAVLQQKGAPQEQALFEAMQACAPQIDRAFAAGDFQAALTRLAGLRADVDLFFEKVMVNAEDLQLRQNRLALLARLHAMMNRVADISTLAT